MQEIEIFSSDSHRITTVQQDEMPSDVVISFTEYSNRKLEGLGFGGSFVVGNGMDLIAVKANKDNWHQDLPYAALLMIIEHLERTGRQKLRRIGYGSSMGGYAAIKFSRRLNFSRVVAISPQFDINQRWDTRYRPELDFQGRVEAIRAVDLQPGCLYFMVADPYDLDGIHLRNFEKLIPAGQLVMRHVPFAGHPVGHLLNNAGVLKGFSLDAFSGGSAELDRTKIRLARHKTRNYLTALIGLCIAKRKLKWAEQLCRGAIRIETDGMFRALLSTVLEATNRQDEAINAARDAVTISPEHEHFLKRYCALLHSQDRLNEAIPELGVALEIMPETAGVKKLMERAKAVKGSAPIRTKKTGDKPVQASATAAPASVRINGTIDVFQPPRIIGGWVLSSDHVGDGQDIEVTVMANGRIIGAGRPTIVRADVLDEPGYKTGFKISCEEDISDEEIAFQTIRVEANKPGLAAGELRCWDRLRANAFTKLFEWQSHVGVEAAAAILAGLCHSKLLNAELREALSAVHDLHFRDEAKRLMMRFESLGLNCSLGGMQRGFGAEPLGLLRWSGLSAEALVMALKTRFAGVGEPEFTRLEPNPGEREYYSTDTRYFMSTHTFFYEGEGDYSDLYERQCRKIQFLVRNMLEKLEEGEKIFVVQAMPSKLSDESLAEVQAAIFAYGRSPLLYLEAATAECPAGTVLQRADGIYQGWVNPVLGDLVKPVAEVRESWLSVLKKTVDMVDKAAAAKSPALPAPTSGIGAAD